MHSVRGKYGHGLGSDLHANYPIINVVSFDYVFCNGLTRVNYEEMKRRAALIDHSDATSGSTNIARFIGFFENDNEKWMNDINDYLMDSEDEQ